MSEGTITRVPAGCHTGGEFTAHQHAEANITLDRSFPGDPVGYTWKAENYSGPQLVEAMLKAGELSPAARDMRVEEVLDQLAGANAVDREDEYSFDSDEFPKIITREQLSCSDAWAGELAPEHLVVGDEFPYCARCEQEFPEMSTLDR